MPDRDTRTRIPVLAPEAVDLLADLARADITVDEIARKLLLSPSIAARIIACANSAWSSPVTPVASVKDACIRLGLKVVRTTVIALAIGRSFDPRSCPAFEARAFWAKSIVTSNFACAIAASRGLDVNVAQTAGLLNQIGLLWLASERPSEANEALTTLQIGTCENLDDSLTIQGVMSVADATLTLFNAWNFPGILIATVSVNTRDFGDSSYEHMARCVQDSGQLAREIMQELDWADSSGPKISEDLDEVYAAEKAALPRTLELARAIR